MTTSYFTPDWTPYTGEYEKKFYDIRLNDGSIRLYCWPNAGTFHPCKPGDDHSMIDGDMVKEIKPTSIDF